MSAALGFRWAASVIDNRAVINAGLRSELERALGERIASAREVSGGDISRAELRHASAQVEKARHLDEQVRRAEARARERRLDEQADDAALQRRTMPRRA